MLMTRWQPFLITRPNEQPARAPSSHPTLGWSYPLVNLWNDADNVYVEAEVPGLDHADLEVCVTHGDQLTLRGERKHSAAEGTWHRCERGVGKFNRLVQLPCRVEADKVGARLENGVLLVTLPKAEVARPRRITVRAE